MSKEKTESAEETSEKARIEALKTFDLEDPEFPAVLDEFALGAGGYPYAARLKKKPYKKQLRELQLEMLKLQTHIAESGERMVVLFEGRDTSGKGGCIARILERINPRHARSVALSKPTDAERGQWYFQRYVSHFPTRGDIVLFDRSWYNRAGVERVMGFCTEDEVAQFLRDVPEFEALLVRDGIHVFKLYLTVGREMQLKRFHERRHEPFKQWKVTDIDRAAIGKYDDYTKAEEEMLRFTHTPACPWNVINANDQRRARLEAMRVILTAMEYPDKNAENVGAIDPKLTKTGADHLASRDGEDQRSD